jgi:hypothetical protein
VIRGRRSASPARGLIPLLAAVALALPVAACGSSSPPPPWRTGHPDPGSLSLLDSAQAGSCASTAPDPDQAPAAISFQGQEYVQASRQPGGVSILGLVEIDHTGDWSFWVSGSDLLMVTPNADFLYRPGNC